MPGAPRFSALQAMKSLVGPGNEATFASLELLGDQSYRCAHTLTSPGTMPAGVGLPW